MTAFDGARDLDPDELPRRCPLWVRIAAAIWTAIGVGVAGAVIGLGLVW